ncbi:putative TetR family transcriptional regulator [Gordonia effusa NBRC 100432]|uniref:Putative TetR family transcriptional regulator n=1 Tax=Gordonia effusa NBRC 100432 TaxID=1077974 RepID=H0R192_9ACTN|nr:TetR/AcrR family transcriptional regulator [Gordonia effusa]GAB18843.1 putative TetR family transcriptional regulator [Gordonia effusa NBRC 100432]
MTDPQAPVMGIREARNNQVRTRILEAALETLVANGYARTSTLAVQKKADVSRGRLLHHFPSRDALLIAAVHHMAKARIQAMSYRRDWPADPIERISAGIDYGWSTFHQPYFVAANELWTAARTNEPLRLTLEPVEKRLGPLVRDAITSFFGAELSDAPDYPALQAIMYSSMRGAATTYLITRRDPRSDPHLPMWKDMAQRYLLPTSAG